jgi:hypothetical protein
MVVRDTVASIVTIGDAGTTDTFRSNEKGRTVACGLFFLNRVRKFKKCLMPELLFSDGIYFALPAVSSPEASDEMTAPVFPRAGAVFHCS